MITSWAPDSLIQVTVDLLSVRCFKLIQCVAMLTVYHVGCQYFHCSTGLKGNLLWAMYKPLLEGIS